MRIGRLKSRPQFLKIADSGHKAVTKSFVVFCLFDFVDKQLPSSQKFDVLFGVTATKKNGNAVVRNRLKRRLRALVRQSDKSLEKLSGAGLVFIARHSLFDTPYDDLQAEMRKVLNYLSKQKGS